MNENERFRAVLHHRLPDRIPWVTRMSLWYIYHKSKGTLPEKYRDWSLWDVQRDLGIGIKGRAGFYKKVLTGVEVNTRKRDGEILTEFVTPVGTVSTLDAAPPDLAVHADTGEAKAGESLGSARSEFMYPAEHMIKSPDDFGPVEYLIEHTQVVPTYEDLIREEERIGGDGIVLPRVDRVPIQDILVHFIGVSSFFYHLQDNLNQVEHLLKVLTDFHRDRIWPLALECPAEFVIIASNLSGMLTTPRLFEKYFMPYSLEFSSRLHAKGKLLATHHDGEPQPLLDLVPKSGLDMVEALTPRPMFRCTVGDARRAYGDNVIIWGGIPSNILCPDAATDDQFEEQMQTLFDEISPGNNFILGMGDNIMPEASLDRVRRVTELVNSRGWLPIKSREQGSRATDI